VDLPAVAAQPRRGALRQARRSLEVDAPAQPPQPARRRSSARPMQQTLVKGASTRRYWRRSA
jgi:hypothetical protein